MTIGFVLDDTLDKPDGVQAAVITLGKELSRRGHEVHYITADTKRSDISNIHSIGRYKSFKFNGNSIRTPLPASKKQIRELFARTDFDVLHIQMPFSPLLAGRVIKLAPQTIKIVGTFHILPYSWFAGLSTRLLGLMLRQYLKRIKQFIAVSEPARAFMLDSFGKGGVVIPNPVDYTFFHRFKKKKHTNKQIVYVGRFDVRKGAMQLLQAYSQLPAIVRNNADLIMCGKGPLLEKAKQFAKVQKLNVDFRGFVSEEDKAQVLADADVAVFPSKGGESFGIVLVEAMAAGAGVTIGGNNEGYASVLAPWPDTLFDPTDSRALADVLQQAMQTRRYAIIGDKQQQDVKKYDVKVVAERLLSEYRA